jgi:hypothetical protein
MSWGYFHFRKLPVLYMFRYPNTFQCIHVMWRLARKHCNAMAMWSHSVVIRLHSRTAPDSHWGEALLKLQVTFKHHLLLCLPICHRCLSRHLFPTSTWRNKVCSDPFSFWANPASSVVKSPKSQVLCPQPVAAEITQFHPIPRSENKWNCRKTQ